MPISQGESVVNRFGQIVFDVDRDLGARDFLVTGNPRVLDGSKNMTVALAAAMATSGFLWTCHEGIWRVGTVSAAYTVAGGASAALQLAVCPQSVAPGSGVNQLTAALDLTTTAPAVKFGTLIATPTVLTRGDSIAYVMSGTLTGLVGVATVGMWRVG